MSEDLNKAVPVVESTEIEETPAVEATLQSEQPAPEVDDQSNAEEEPDFAHKSLKELSDALANLIDGEDVQKLCKYAEAIKANFYKTLHRERVAAGCPEPEAGEVELENTADTPAQGVSDANEQEGQGEETARETASANPFEEIERGFKNLLSKYKTIRASHLKEQAELKEANYEEKSKILAEIKALVEENPDDIGKAYPRFRELQNRWRAVGPVPALKAKDLYESYNHNVEVFYDFVKINRELRDIDFKKNLEAKEELCRKAEELADSENSVAAFRTLQKLHDEWKELGPVAKEVREEIWERFKAATARINKKYQGFFEEQKAAQVKNLELKTVLCEKAEAIANSELKPDSDWGNLSKQMQDLQKEWRTIGFAVRKENDKIYERFRAAFDKFYNIKKEFHTEHKDQLKENLEKKIALCEQAEALADSQDWKQTSDILINLQKQWKEIGPVVKKKSDQVWNRFRAACDKFFDNKAKNGGGKGSEMAVNLAAKKALIADIEAYEPQEDNEAQMAALKEFQARWAAIGFIPFKMKDKIAEAYNSALSAKFGDLVEELRPRRSRGENRQQPARPMSERDKLIDKYGKLEQDIATWENNLGFFKNAGALLDDLRKQIDQAKSDLAELEEKIKQLGEDE
ncbi:MAG: DUF349 domain-containing protein [Bacteroidales bacterium]|nr:DUF349 domain-containing protein [Bacteroidales bacterium]